MTSGTIFNIQRFCLHDGPGIRTVVFLKGCPLNCLWCHNPEGISARIQAVTSSKLCLSCGACREVCEFEKCNGCGKCVSVCPSGARKLIGKRASIEEVMEIVLKDRIYYEESDGGVTFSGGEPLAQAEFLYGLLDASKKEDIHTAIETSGFAPWSVLERIATKTDLFLYDIKNMDEEQHRLQTGESNRMILDNLQKLGEIHGNIIVRLPIVPNRNDSPELIETAEKFAKSIKGVRSVQQLPYHDTGEYKSEMINRERTKF